MDQVAAIVLAAGYSSRMGELKPLLDLNDRSLLEWAVRAFTQVGIDDVVVVVGHRGDEVGTAVSRLGARVVVNDRYERGMYSSVQAGVVALRPEVRRFFLLPVDCPLVRPETVGRLTRHGAGAGADVVVPVFAGAPGHPPLLSAALRDEILATEPPGGLRSLLQAGHLRAVSLEVGDRGVALDADTPGDLERLREASRGEDLPSEERCLEVLRTHGVSNAVVAHSRAVAAVAAALTTALNEHAQYLCLPLVAAAALLHDVARAEARHAEAGATLLEDLGYARVAGLVRRHMDLGCAGRGDIAEAEVLYLADKMVLGAGLVTVEQRFASRLERFAGEPAALAAAQARLEVALLLRDRVQRVLGRELSLPSFRLAPGRPTPL